MLKMFSKIIVVVALAFATSGCALLGAAIGAAASYGIYQATQ